MIEKFKIDNDGQHTHIYIGEKEIPRITNFNLSQGVGEIPTLELTIYPQMESLELEGKIICKYYDLNGKELILKEIEGDNNDTSK